MAISGTTGHVTLMLLCFYSMYENLNPIIVIFSGCTVMHSQAQSMHSKAQSGTQMHSKAQSMHSTLVPDHMPSYSAHVIGY